MLARRQAALPSSDQKHRRFTATLHLPSSPARFPPSPSPSPSTLTIVGQLRLDHIVRPEPCKRVGHLSEDASREAGVKGTNAPAGIHILYALEEARVAPCGLETPGRELEPRACTYTRMRSRGCVQHAATVGLALGVGSVRLGTHLTQRRLWGGRWGGAMGARERAIASSEQRREGLGQRRADERQVMSVPPSLGRQHCYTEEAATTKALGQLWPGAEQSQLTRMDIWAVFSYLLPWTLLQ